MRRHIVEGSACRWGPKLQPGVGNHRRRGTPPLAGLTQLRRRGVLTMAETREHCVWQEAMKSDVSGRCLIGSHYPAVGAQTDSPLADAEVCEFISRTRLLSRVPFLLPACSHRSPDHALPRMTAYSDLNSHFWHSTLHAWALSPAARSCRRRVLGLRMQVDTAPYRLRAAPFACTPRTNASA